MEDAKVRQAAGRKIKKLKNKLNNFFVDLINPTPLCQGKKEKISKKG